MGFGPVLEYWRVLLTGFKITIEMAVVAIGAGTALGVAVGTAVSSKKRAVRWPFALLVNVFRGSPLLIQLFLIYFGLVYWGLNIGVLTAAMVGLSIYTGAYIAEIIRSGIQAIPVGQSEAAGSLGLSHLQTMARVILPQMTKMVAPAMVSWYLTIIKDTSIASIIGVADVISQGKAVIAATEKPFQTYLVIAAAYFTICFPLSRAVRWYEMRGKAA